MRHLTIYAMIYLGAALMVLNICGFVRFARYIRGIKTWGRNNRVLYVPIVLLVCFLLGYLMVGFFGKPDLVIAGILLGGSIFVFVMYKMLNSIVQKVMEAEHLEAELLAAEESNRAKSSFLSSISHEMRTPMNVILGMNALALKHPELPKAAREQLEKADNSARHLSRLIDDLLTMQEAERNGLTMHEVSFPLMETLEQISAKAAEMCRQKGLEYEKSFAKCAARNYIGDAAELKRAVTCILDNAVKYTDAPGTVRFRVKCSKAQNGDAHVMFIVSDTGIGIDEAFLTRIFEPLTQEDGSSTNRFGGSGMGLTVANSIVTHMGGSIKVESEKGVGSTFTITVPVSPVPNAVCAGCKGCTPEQAQDCDTCTICRLGQAAIQHPAPIDLAGKRVLIAEDTDDNAEIVADLLELEDIESERAENGLAAVKMVEASPAFHYDAVLMDLRMPVMDGWEAARKIRALDRPDAKVMPIIALSANNQERDVQQSLEAGMNEHLAKPIEADVLYESLRKNMRSAYSVGGGGKGI